MVVNLKLGKYGVWAKKYLEEYKPFKFSRLVMDGSVMDYLLEFEYHLKSYANLVEFENLGEGFLLLLRMRVLLSKLRILI